MTEARFEAASYFGFLTQPFSHPAVPPLRCLFAFCTKAEYKGAGVGGKLAAAPSPAPGACESQERSPSPASAGEPWQKHSRSLLPW